jgi:putative transposase
VDFVRRWSEETEIGAGRFIRWLDITASKFYGGRERYGKVNEHNGWVPRDFWLEEWEKQAIIAFHLQNPLEGYRRLTLMMLDADIVAVSPASVWRVLGRAGLPRKWNGKPSKKGTGLNSRRAAPALAYRCFLPECLRDVLLPVQPSWTATAVSWFIGICGNR